MAGLISISPFSSLNFDESMTPSENGRYRYTQGFIPLDVIRVQVVTEKTTSPNFYLINESGVQMLISSIAYPFDDYNVYDVPITRASEYGQYTFEIRIGSEVVASSVFCIIGEECAKDTVLLSYTNRENAFNTVFVNDGNYIFFNFRIDAGFFPAGVQPGVDNEEFRNQNDSLTQLSASPYVVKALSFGENLYRGVHGHPIWVPVKINQIFSLTEIYVDDQLYVRSESSVPEKEEVAPSGSGLFLSSIDLEESVLQSREAPKPPGVIYVNGKVVDSEGAPLGTAYVSIQNNGVTVKDLGYIDYAGSIPEQSWEISQQDYNSQVLGSAKVHISTISGEYILDYNWPAYQTAISEGMYLYLQLSVGPLRNIPITVTVLDLATGLPLYNAKVDARTTGYSIFNEFTDIQGRVSYNWRINNSNYNSLTGKLTFIVTHQNYYQESVDVDYIPFAEAIANGYNPTIQVKIADRDFVTVSGRVTDAQSGAGVSGATVGLYSDSNFIGQAASGSDGSYSYRWNISNGEWHQGGELTMVVSQPGYYLGEGFIILPSYQDAVENDITVNVPISTQTPSYPPINIFGRITDAQSGVAIPSAAVNVVWGTIGVGSAYTDSSGQYSIAVYMTSNVYNQMKLFPMRIGMAAIGYVTDALTATPPINYQDAVDDGIPGNWQLHKSVAPEVIIVTGKVVDSKGAPLGTAYVSIQNNGVTVKNLGYIDYAGSIPEQSWEISQQDYNSQVLGSAKVHISTISGEYILDYNWPAYQTAISNGIDMYLQLNI